nr:MYRTX1-Pr8b protein [Pogonomyrmex rugosus]
MKNYKLIAIFALIVTLIANVVGRAIDPAVLASLVG